MRYPNTFAVVFLIVRTPTAVPADAVLAFQKVRKLLDGRILLILVIDTELAVFHAAAVLQRTLDELLLLVLFLRLQQVKHGHLRLLLALSVFDPLFVLLTDRRMLFFGFILFGCVLVKVIVHPLFIAPFFRFIRCHFRLFVVKGRRLILNFDELRRLLFTIRHRLVVGHNVDRFLILFHKENAMIFYELFYVFFRCKIRETAHGDAFRQTYVTACEREVEFLRRCSRVFTHYLVKITQANENNRLRLFLLRFKVTTIDRTDGYDLFGLFALLLFGAVRKFGFVRYYLFFRVVDNFYLCPARLVSVRDFLRE